MTRSGGHFHEHPPGLRAEARRLRRTGKTVREVAHALGLPQSTVGVWIRGVDPEHECPLCGVLVVGSWGWFCSQAHRVKYRAVFGSSQDYKKETA